MLKYAIRFQVMLLALLLIIIAASQVSYLYLPSELGLIAATDGQQEVIIDLDRGTRAVRNSTFAPTPQFQRGVGYALINVPDSDLPIVYHLSQPQDDAVRLLRTVGDQTQVIAHYDDLNPTGLFWQPASEQLLLIDAAFDRGTHVYSVTLETGDLTEIVAIPDLDASEIRPSPDNRYLLLRASPRFRNRGDNDPQPMVLLDTQTVIVRDLGLPEFVYWSPNSQYLAVGYSAANNPVMIDVSIYQPQQDEMNYLGYQILQIDVHYFDNVQGNGIAWHPDSSGIAILNQLTERLQYITFAGEEYVVENSNLKPYLWSPDGRHMLAIGYVEDQIISVYIVDFEAGTAVLADTGQRFSSFNHHLLWTHDSQHIAYFERAIGFVRATTVTIFNTEGDIIRNRIPFTIGETAIGGLVVRWLDAIRS